METKLLNLTVFIFLLQFTTAFALSMRLADLWAIADPDFELSRGFHTMWRSHFWQSKKLCMIELQFFVEVDMSCNEPKKSILNGAEVSIGSVGSLNLISHIDRYKRLELFYYIE